MRALKVIGLIVFGAALSAAGLIGWYHWGRNTPGPYSIPIDTTKDSSGGMTPTSCQINGSQTEALAWGVYTNAAPSGQDTIELFVVGSHAKQLGNATQNVDNAGAGVDWTLQASLTQGFGPPLDCYVQIYSNLAEP